MGVSVGGQSVGDGRVCWWVCGCVNEVYMEFTECGDGLLVWGGPVCILRCGWVGV